MQCGAGRRWQGWRTTAPSTAPDSTPRLDTGYQWVTASCPGGVTDRGGGQRLVARPATARARPPRARVGGRLPAPALRVSDGRARRRRGCLLATHRALRQAAVGLAGLVADDCSTQVPCVMTHASSARQLTARTKTANRNGLRNDCGCGRPPRRSGLHRGPAVRPPETVVAMALADHAFKAGRQPGDDGVTI